MHFILKQALIDFLQPVFFVGLYLCEGMGHEREVTGQVALVEEDVREFDPLDGYVGVQLARRVW